MARLIFTDERFRGQIYDVKGARTTVGRSRHNMLSIQEQSISRHHCEIFVYGPEVIVRDLGSRNGTMVAGRMLIGSQCQARGGQIICFGAVQALLELDIIDSENEESTALHEFLRWQKRSIPQTEAEQVQIGSDSTGRLLDPTIHWRAIPGPELHTWKDSGPKPFYGNGTRAFNWILTLGLLLLGLILLLRK